MRVFGNLTTYMLTIDNGANGVVDLSSVASTEKLIKVSTYTEGLHVLLTPASSATNADAEDFMLSKYQPEEFGVGRGLDRITVFNNSGSDNIKVSIAVLY